MTKIYIKIVFLNFDRNSCIINSLQSLQSVFISEKVLLTFLLFTKIHIWSEYNPEVMHKFMEINLKNDAFSTVKIT